MSGFGFSHRPDAYSYTEEHIDQDTAQDNRISELLHLTTPGVTLCNPHTL